MHGQRHSRAREGVLAVEHLEDPQAVLPERDAVLRRHGTGACVRACVRVFVKRSRGNRRHVCTRTCAVGANGVRSIYWNTDEYIYIYIYFRREHTEVYQDQTSSVKVLDILPGVAFFVCTMGYDRDQMCLVKIISRM